MKNTDTMEKTTQNNKKELFLLLLLLFFFHFFPVNIQAQTPPHEDDYGSATFTVIDNVFPILTTPASQSVEGCNANAIGSAGLLPYSTSETTITLAQLQAQGGNASDNSTITSITYVDSAPSGSCPQVVTRTYRVTDDCGNISVGEQTINIDDNTSPVITGSIAVTTIEGCSASAAPSAVTTVSSLEGLGLAISDTCTPDASLVVTSSDSSSGTCPIVITRTYTVTDACGNFTTYNQTINIDDNTSPVITGSIAVTTIEGCSASAAPSAVTTVSSLEGLGLAISDTCTPDASLVVTSSDSSSGTCPIVITRTYTVTDACGNFTTYNQTINIDDNTSPVITGSIAVTTIEGCSASAAPSAVTTVSSLEGLGLAISDTCTPDASLVVTSSDSSSGTCPIVITRTYTVTDACGNFTTYNQTINIDDNTSPVITGSIAVTTIEGCSASAAPSAVTTVSSLEGLGLAISDTCTPDASLVVTSSDSSSGTCPIVITRTYTVTDACGNFTTYNQTINIDDNTSPVITGSIAVTTIEGCSASAAPSAVTTVSSLEGLGLAISDTCTPDASLVVTSSDSSSGTCPIVITRTYTVTDACGNFTTYNQTINIDDNTSPVITGSIAVTTIEGCSASAAPSAVTTVSSLEGLGLAISDTCTPDASLVVTSSDSSSGTCPIVITRTYTVTDACGNFTTYNQTINIDDNTSPVITGSIAVTTIEGCSASAAPSAVTTVSSLEGLGLAISDTCTPDASLVVTSSDSSSGTCPIVITRTYTVTDACGNFTTYNQTINIDDNTSPVITGSIAVTTIEGCSASAAPSAVTTVSSLEGLGLAISDTCTPDASLVVTSSDSSSGTCPIVITRTYTVTDACGNFSTYNQTINIDDNTSPVITGSIAVTTIEGCSASAAPSAVTTVSSLEGLGLAISDTCTPDASLVVTSSDSSSGTCPIVITRTYTVTDACGNFSTYNQTINIDDNTSPVITGSIAVTTIEGCSASAAPSAVTTVSSLEGLGLAISDTCTPDASLVVTSSDSSSGTCPIVITRTYTVTDACGNFTTYNQTINIDDTTAPLVVCPSDQTRTIPSGQTTYTTSNTEFDFTSLSDTCGIVSATNNLNATNTLSGYVFPLGDTLVTWTATDTCGNTSSCSFTVSVISSELTATKSTLVTTYSSVGEEITYTIEVSNSGSAPIYTVNVTDINADTGSVAYVSGDTSNTGVLDTGEIWVYTATHTVTQEDLDAGSVLNTATANGVDTNGNPVSDASDPVTVTAAQTPVLTTVKTATTTTYAAVGDLIHYNITVTNTGNVTVSGITLTDPNAVVTCAASPYTLLPGESFRCTAVHTVTQADIDAGSVLNTATANGVDTNGNPVSDASDPVTVTAAQTPVLTTVKTATTTTYAAVGDLIHYNITVTNTGNVTVSGITLTDPNAVVTCAASPYTLLPGESFRCTAVHTVTQADIDAGSVLNTATANGVDTNGNPVSDASDPVTVTAAQTPVLTTVKTATTTTYAAVGDLIHYNITVTNTGNVTVSGITLTDPNAVVTCAASPYTLLPGESFRCTAVHTVTQADIDAGSVLNTATANGVDTNGNPVSDASDPVTVTAAQTPVLTTVKTATTTTYAAVGDLIHYNITVTNTGNVTVSGITLTDPNAVVTCAASPYTLLPGESFRCTAVHTVTQADIDAGSVLNTATANGVDTNGNPVSDASDPVTVTAAQTPVLTTVKTATTTTYAAVGDLIHYNITVTNTGNVTVSGITLTDPNAVVTCAASPYTLLPGESFTCTAVHTVTQADIDAGSVLNTATANGVDTNGNPVSDASDPVTVTAAQTPVLTTVKTATTTTYAAVGDLIHYNITVTNTGNVTVSGITLTDPNAVVTCAASPYTLLPGESFRCTAVHTVTQADIDAGSVLNTATANGVDTNGNPVSDASDPVTVTAAQTPVLTTVKTATTTTYAAVGDLIHYNITVTNTGNVTVSGITLTDPNAVVTCAASPYTLLPGESFRCTAVHTVTQADIDAGSVLNTATANGVDTNGNPVSDASDPVTVTAAQTPVLTTVKTATTTTYAAVGDLIHYNITVTNTGNVTVSGITLTDPNAVVTCAASPYTLLPGESFRCTAVHTVTQADIDAGSVLNTATANGVDTNGNPVSDASDPVTVTAAQTPVLTTVKTATTTTYAAVGDLIHYNITVTNTGNVTVSGITLTDPNAVVTCAASPYTLLPGESFRCTAVHTVTQADIDAGSVLNTATANGVDTNGNPVSDASDPVTVTAAQTPVLTTVKTATTTTYAAVGDLIHYNITVTNTGNVTVSGITLTDPNAVVTCAASPYTLLPGESFTCTAVHTVTQADIDAGSVLNTATANGVDTNGNPVSDASDPVTVTAAQTPVLTTVKTATTTTYAAVGDLIHYNITVTNTGNVTVSGITLTDPNAVVTCAASPYTLLPGESFRCTAVHTVTQADIDAGSVLNTATANGVDTNGNPVSDASDPVTVTAAQTPVLTTVKTATTTTYAAVGDLIHYNITVTNTGNVTVSGITLTDPNAVVTCAASPYTLLPGESFRCTAVHTVTQADIDAGSVLNTATANGVDTNGNPVSDASDPVTVTAAQTPVLTTVKTATTTTYAAVGDLIHYNITVTNTGNVTVSGITLTDPNAVVTCAASPYTLLPGESFRCTAVHTVTQADIDAGSVLNTATANGVDTNGNPVSDASDPVTVTAAQTPVLTTVKTATTTTYAAVGDLIHYNITVTNTGNVTVSGITLTDPNAVVTCAASPYTLLPGESFRCTAVHTVTQADIDAGSVLNTATANGVDTNGNPVSDASDPVTVTAAQTPVLTTVKTATTTTYAAVGDLIHYNITVTNTGNVTVSGITLTDPNAVVTCAASPYTLLPGESFRCTAVHTVTQADIDAGSVLNTATANGVDTNGNPVSDASDPVTVTAAQTPVLTTVKTATTTTYAAVGDLIHYNITVTNTGNVTVSGITLTDPNAVVTCAASPYTLLPGESFRCTAVHTVTQADIDAGSVLNTATANGVDTNGNPVSDASDPVTVTAAQTPVLTTVKTATTTTYAAVGDLIHYNITVTNTGNVTVSGITLTDPNAVVTCAASPYTLLPGESFRCTAVHTVTQADIDAGSVLNTATANGVDTNGNPVSDASDPVTVTAAQTPVLTTVKTATTTTYAAVGDLIHYNITVTNTGNVTVSGITLTDPNAVVTCAASPYTLLPGESFRCTAVHTVTQADIDAGSVLNTATANGVDTNGNPVSDASDPVTVTAAQTPVLTTVKTATTTTYAAVGDLIHYNITVTNTGNVTVSGITLTDPNAVVTCAASPYTLLPGESFRCTAVHTVTQADIDAGSVLNTATANGVDTNGNPVSDASDPVTVTAAQTPVLTTVKTATTTTYAAVGDLIHYNITVTNTGNVTVSGITLTDPNAVVTCAASPYTLLPGESFRCTAVHTVTQADIDAGSVLNTATANGVDTNGNPVSDASDPVTVTAAQTPVLTTVKTATTTTYAAVGDLIHYNITVTNTGNVTVSGITLTDPNAVVTCAASPYTLLPGESFRCTAVHTVTQADIDAGSVLNTATANGVDTNGNPVSDASDPVTVTAAQTPVLTTVKTATTTTYAAVGDLIHYNITVTNTGNVTVSGITLTDPNAVVTCAASPYTLLPGESFTCTAVHTVTQADIDAGSVLNTATANGVDTNGNPVSDASDPVTVTAAQTPVLTTVKTATTTTYAAVGDLIHYNITVTNTGNVTVSGITLTDPNAVVTCAASPYTLLPGESFRCTAVHTVTQADIDAGSVLNTATANGVDTNGNPVSDASDPVTVTAAQTPVLTTVKTATTTTYAAVGDLIHYNITVTNTGNVTVSGITLTDPNAVVTCAASPYTLLPGESFRCTAVHTVTQADIDAGSVLNTATANGVDTNGNPVSDASDPVTVTAAQTPVLTTVKTATTTTYAAVGDLIHYNITVTNTGNVTVSGITLTDPNAVVTCAASPYTLLPGESFTCTAVHTVTQADIDAGSVLNTATANGVDTNGNPVSDASDPVTVTAAQTPVLTTVKTATTTTYAAVGDLIHYNITVTNTGNVTVSGITLTDPNAVVTCAASPYTLLPGESFRCTAVHTVTQADIDAGSVLNTATANGVDTNGNPVSDASDPVTVTAAQTITVSDVTENEGVTLTFEITLSGISVTDVVFTPSLSSISATIGTDTTSPIQYSLDGGNTWNDWNGENLTFVSGQTSILFSVPSVDDNIVENQETFNVNINVISGNTANTNDVGIGTIVDNDSNTIVVLGDAVTEGDTLQFTVALTNPSSTPVTFTPSFIDGTAILSTDTDTPIMYSTNGGVTWLEYTGGNITIPIGSQSVLFEVPTIDDVLVETNENISLSVAVVSGNVSNTTASNTGIILDNDEAFVSINDVVVNESDGTAIFTVTLTGNIQEPITITYSTSDITAINGSDYTAVSGSITFNAGSVSGSTVTITVPILNDNLVEVSETFNVNLTSINSTIVTISNSVGLGTIIDEDVILADDAAMTPEDTPVIIDVLSNDTFASDDTIEVTDVTDPANGTVVINPDGSVTYTPDADFTGTDTFTYTVTVYNADGTTTTETATVTVVVTPVADAVDDTATTPEDTPVAIAVLDNDTFEGTYGTDYAVTDVTDPANGTVVINPDGSVTYTPDADFTGTDTFTYTVTVYNADGTTTTETATVTVVVTPVADAVDDTATTPEDTPVAIAVLDNDTFEGTYGTDYAVTDVTDPANGTVVINPDGSVTYTPDADFTGTDTFTYTVTVYNADGTTTTETATVTVVVTPVADAVDDTATTPEDTPVAIAVLDNDTFEGTYGTDYAVTDVTDPANGTVVINPDGSVTYTPDADFNGTDTFTYTVTVYNGDGTTTTETATVTVTVTPVADAVDDTATTPEDTPVDIEVLSNDTFTGTYGVDYAVTDVTDPANGTVVINPDGSVTYTPDADFTGTDTFTYTVTVYNADGTTTTETATVTVVVTPVADAVDDTATTPEDTPVAIAVLDNDTFEGTYGTDYAVTDVTDPANGTVVINPDGSVTYTPDADFTGTDTFTYTVTVYNADGTTTTETATVTVVVTPVADAVDDTATTPEDTPVAIAVLDNDTFEGTYGTDYAVTDVTDPANGTVVINPDGSVTYTPDADFTGTDTFTYTVTVYNADGTTTTETATVTVVVTPVADAVDDTATTPEDTPVAIAVLDNDTFEGTYGTDYAVTDVTDPANGTVVINPDGSVTYTPDADFTGTDTFTYTVTVYNADGTTTTETATVTVVVTPVADAVDDTATTPEDTPVDIEVLSNDTFTGTYGVDYAVTDVTDPANGTVVINPDGTVTYTPDADFTGTDTFTYTVTVYNADGTTTTETATVTVVVTPVADAVDDTATTPEDTPVAIAVLDNDTFEGTYGTDYAVTDVTDPANGTVVINPDGSVTYTPDADFTGTDTFTYTVTVYNADGTTTTETATVTVVVTPVADAVDDTATTPEDTPVAIAVLDNDTFEGTYGTDYAVTDVTDPANGTVVINPDGSVTYTPDADFTGTDTFTYTVTVYNADGTTTTETATVTVVVTPVADAVDDTATTPEDTPVAIAVLDNDTFEGTYGTDYAVTDVTDPANGTVVINPDGSVTYTPDADFTGTDTFTYTVTVYNADGTTTTETATVTVVVTPVADAVDDTATTPEDTPVAIAVLDNDTFEGTYGTDYAVTDVTDPANGTVVINPDGSVTYTPDADFTGTDTFTYTVTVYNADGTTTTETATVTVVVTPVADAVDDTATTPEDTPVAIAVLDNDTFEGTYGTDYAVTDVTDPANGTVVINPDGSVTYTPDADFTGTDTFTYTVTVYNADGTTTTETATVTVVVTPVADAVDDTATTPEDTPVAIAVLDNDTFEGTYGTDYAVTDVTDPANGTVVINPDGSVTYTPDADFTGTDTFTYTVTVYNADGTTTTETATVTVVVTPVADAVDDTATTPEDTPVAIAVLDNDTFEGTYGTDYAVTDVTDPANGTVVINPDGSVTYTPDADFTGTDTFTYTVTVYNADGTTTTETATVTVVVTPVADAVDDTATTPEDTPVAIAVLDNDTFEGTYGTDYAVTDVTDPANGTVVINPDGSVTYTPDADFTGTDTFTYTVTVYNADGTTTTETATVTVTVTPVADAIDDTATTPEDTPVDIEVLSNDTFTGTYGVDYAVTDVTDPANGTVVINPDGTVTYTPDADFNGTDTFTYTVTVYNGDGTTTTETATVTVTVTPVADAVDDTATTPEDTPVAIAVLDNDTFEGTYGTDYAVTDVTDPANGTVVINPDGSVTYTPDADFTGTDTFTYTVTVYNADGTTTTETATVTVVVTPVADAVDDTATTPEDTPVAIAVLDNDTFEGTYGTDYAVTDVTDPANGTVVINPDGSVTYTPDADFTGTDTFTYTVTVYNADGTTTTETATVTVTVTPVADAIDDTATTPEDTPVDIEVLSNDTFTGTYGTDYAVTDVTDPANGTVVINPDGTVTYTPDADFNGTDTFTYTVTVYNADGTTTTETATVTVVVTPVADAVDDTATTPEDTPVAIAVLDNDTFEGTYGTDYAVTDVTDPANGTVVINPDGSVTYTPDADFTGTDTFTYTVTVYNADGTTTTETATVTVVVTPVADAVDDTATTPEDTPVAIAVLDNDTFEGTYGTDYAVTDVTDPANGTVVINPDGSVTYTPDADFTGTDTFTYTVTVYNADGTTTTETATVTVVVTPVADAVDDTATTPEDTPVAIAVLDNDTFEGTYGTDYAVTDVTDPANGTVVINPDGSVTYTPDADFTGTDTFTYTVTVYNADGTTTTETATVTVVVTPVADAVDDTATTPEDTPVAIAVLDNDTFEGTYGTDYAVTDVTDPANGTVVINPDGSVTYTPDADFTGTDTFTYTVTVYNADGTTTTETATVTVVVTPVADAVDDTATTPEDTPVAIAVLDNDTFEGTYGTDYAVTDVTDPANGTVVINPDGSVTYTPDADFTGTDTFTYTVTVYNADGTTTTETATVTVVVTPVADAVDDTATTPEDTPVAIAVLDNDTFEGTYGTDYAVTDVTDPANGTVVINPDGSVTYTPDADFTGTDTFTYTVTVYNADGTTTTETATVTVVVTPVADAVDDTATTPEDTPVAIAVLDNDTFEGTYGTDYAVTDVTDPANGTVVINPDGSVTYTPDADFTGTDTFTYTVTVYNADGTTTTETATVTVVVTPVADAVDDTATTPEDTPVAIAVLDNDTFEGTYGTDYAVTDVTDPANGTVVINPDGSVTYTPDADFTGTDTFTYTVTVYNADGTTTTETATVTVVVTPVADAVDDTATTPEDTPVAIAVLDNDTFEGTYGTDYAVTDVTDPANGTVVINPDGSVTYTPDADFTGTDTFTYTVTVYNADGTTTTETATVTVVVTPVADAVDDTATTPEDTPVAIAVLDNDTFEGTYGTDYAVTDVTDPANGTVVINPDGSVTYTPDADFTGTDTFTYTVTVYNADGTTTTETATVTVVVTPVADAVDDTATTPEDTPVAIAVLDNDTFEGTYGTDYAVTDVTDPANGTVVINPDGSVTYTPDADFTGTDTFTYTVTVYNADGTTTTETATVTVVVTPVADAVDDEISTLEDVSVVVPIYDNDNDIPSEGTLTVTQPDNGMVTIDDGGTPNDPSDDVVTYIPNNDYTGTDTFIYTVCDVEGNCKSATVTIIVVPVPDLLDDSITTWEDESVIVPIYNNDNDIPSEGTLTVTQPDNGMVTIDDGGTPNDPSDDIVSYQPNEDFNGTDTFIYTVCDTDGNCVSATVIITVLPTPDAENDTAITDANISVDIPIYDNDNDIPSDGTLTVTQPDNGTVIIDDNGTPDDPSDDVVTYIPDVNFTGTDIFTYTICDSDGNCSSATVTIEVEANDCLDKFPGHGNNHNDGFGFTPNGDTVNDIFEIKDIEYCYPNYRIEIYNRWGNLVFEYSHNGDPETKPRWWDGASQGRLTLNKDEILPDGTYFYIFYFNQDDIEPINGYIYLTK